MVGDRQTDSFDSRHEGTVLDVQFDFYGTRLATCAADGNINVFAVAENEAPTFLHSFAAYDFIQTQWPCHEAVLGSSEIRVSARLLWL